MDLTNLTSIELTNLQNAIEAEQHRRKQQALEAARSQVQEIARSVGIPLDQLIKRRAKDKKAGVMRYRNPANHAEEWTGHGRPPKWYVGLVQSGKVDTARIR